MPVSKELQDLVDEIGKYEHDHHIHSEAMVVLLRVLNLAEERVSEAALPPKMKTRNVYKRVVMNYRNRLGKAFADKTRRSLNECWQLRYPGNFWD